MYAISKYYMSSGVSIVVARAVYAKDGENPRERVFTFLNTSMNVEDLNMVSASWHDASRPGFRRMSLLRYSAACTCRLGVCIKMIHVFPSLSRVVRNQSRWYSRWGLIIFANETGKSTHSLLSSKLFLGLLKKCVTWRCACRK